MKQARLVKQKELLERERQQANQQTATPQTGTVITTIEMVKTWVKERRSSVERVSAREQFNALFSPS